MARPPKDTHGPIVSSGPTRGQNRSRKKNGRWRAKRSDTGVQRKEGAQKSANLAKWFWGSIILMATLSVSLALIAIFRQDAAVTAATPEGTSLKENSNEISASELNALLSASNREAVSKVKFQIAPKLDAVYEPVYAAIPKYADFHYSVLGQYIELGAAAQGDIGGQLADKLFGGLDMRLKRTVNELNVVFSSTFHAVMKEEMTRLKLNQDSVGPLTEGAIKDIHGQLLVSVPMTAVAITSTKAIARIVAQKIATKIAATTALKTGGKWAAVGTTATGAAALCSWTGPIAGVCAAAGGIGAWLVVDYGVVKTDELWNREVFESELQEMVDDRKFKHQIALESAVEERALAVQKMSDALVEQHDFTLREFYGGGNAEICRTATQLVAQYDVLRGNLSERTPEALNMLRSTAKKQVGSLSIGRLAREINDNLQIAERVTIKSLQITGNLPLAQRANRDISGQIILNGNLIEIPRTKAEKNDSLVISMNPEVVFTFDHPLNYKIILEQHLRIKGNRYFGGRGEKKIYDAINSSSALEHQINVAIPISHDPNANSLERVITTRADGEFMSLTFELRAAPLAKLKKLPDCK